MIGYHREPDERIHKKTERKQRLRAWIIHRLGGYTHQEVFAKAWKIAQKIHLREYKGGEVG